MAAAKKTTPGAQTGPGPRGRRAGVRSAIRSEEDRPVGLGREEGRQESRQCPQEGGEAPRPLKEISVAVAFRRRALVGRTFGAGVADEVEDFLYLRRRRIRRDARRRTSRAMSNSALARVRIGSVLHPAVVLALADRACIVQNADRPSAQGPDRWPRPLRHQHRDCSCRTNLCRCLSFRAISMGQEIRIEEPISFPKVPRFTSVAASAAFNIKNAALSTLLNFRAAPRVTI